jgi:hypothetical protein
VRLKGQEFVPLIYRAGEVACQLDITWLRREKAGGIVMGGDIDNRLKILFDGLRMPQSESELGPPPPTENERRFVLLEDDKLITRLSVSTYQLLEPQADEKPGNVDLLLHVLVAPTVSDIAFRSSTASAIAVTQFLGGFR